MSDTIKIILFVGGLILFNIVAISSAAKAMYNRDKVSSEYYKKYKAGLIKEGEYQDNFNPTMISLLTNKDLTKEVYFSTYVIRVAVIMLIVAVVSLGIAIGLPMLIESSR